MSEEMATNASLKWLKLHHLRVAPQYEQGRESAVLPEMETLTHRTGGREWKSAKIQFEGLSHILWRRKRIDEEASA